MAGKSQLAGLWGRSSEVAIGKLNQAAHKLNVNLDLLVGDASEYKFGPARFDLIVLFYHADRNLFPKLVSARTPRGLLICKLSLRWDTDARLTAFNTDPLNRNELPSLFPRLHVLHHRERQVRDRGVVEFVGRKKSSICESDCTSIFAAAKIGFTSNGHR